MVMDDVNCQQNVYLTILSCDYSTYIDSGCTNSYDATVYCCKFCLIYYTYKKYLF